MELKIEGEGREVVLVVREWTGNSNLQSVRRIRVKREEFDSQVLALQRLTDPAETGLVEMK